MENVNPAPSGSKPKKKSTPRRRSKASRKGSGSDAKKNAAPEEPPSVETLGRLERTRRLLLAALRVWELKRRVRD